MRYKIEQIADGTFVVKLKHWWFDPLSPKDVIAVVTKLSENSRVVSVCRIGAQYLVITTRE